MPSAHPGSCWGVHCPSHQRLSKASASLDIEPGRIGELLTVLSPVRPSLWELAVPLESVWAPIVPSHTRLSAPPQSWEICSLLLSPSLFFYIKCFFASNFFQVPLLLSAKAWLSATASGNPLSPELSQDISQAHVPWSNGVQGFLPLEWLGEESSQCAMGGEGENIGGKTFKLISKRYLAT